MRVSRFEVVALVVAALLAALGYFVGETNPETRPTGILLTAFLIGFSALLSILVRNIEEMSAAISSLRGASVSAQAQSRSEIVPLQNAVERVTREVDNLRSDIGQLRVTIDGIGDTLKAFPHVWDLAGALDDRWVQALGPSYINRTAEMLGKLRNPQVIYTSEGEMYTALTECADGLIENGELFAICADKSWNTPEVKVYWDANGRAVDRRANIKRVFCEVNGFVIEEAKKQAERGIDAWIVRTDQLRRLEATYHLPWTYGVAIFNRHIVFLHEGLGSQTRARRYDCAELAELVRSHYTLLERAADRIAVGVHQRVPKSSDKPVLKDGKRHD
jgi:hypothetical protein